MIELLETAARKLHTQRQKLSDEVLESPPENYDKFMSVVGEYRGLTKAIMIVDHILHGNENT